MVKIICGVFIGLTISATAWAADNLSRVITPDDMYMIVGGHDPDGNGHIIKMDKEGNVLARCVQ